MYKIFIDSDVVISSLISNLGASYQLINNKNVVCFISNVSYEEQLLVAKKLSLNIKKLKKLVKEKLNTVEIIQDIKKIRSQYKDFVRDINDAHIVMGSVESKTKFLITYNVKDFEANKIKKKFNIQIMTSGSFLQHLRSK